MQRGDITSGHFLTCSNRLLPSREGNLDLTYHPGDGITDRFYTKKNSSENLIPFEYRLEAACLGKSGERLNLSVDLEALKPPMVLGAMDYKGKITMIGQPDTFSLSFTRFKISGTLDLSGTVEHVEGIGYCLGAILHLRDGINRDELAVTGLAEVALDSL
jgi:predicted secreted hydrolase